ncbi:MAG TPA: universal stress protein [Pyrinomonadaceae bacterium]|nr:universal stress protein [Pyrinomonadaceae bacterium]
MKTLLATDGSPEATNALRIATRLLRRDGNDFHILCVAPEYYQQHPEAKKKAERLRAEYERRIIQETDAILERAQGALREEGVDGKTFSLSGSPAKVIVQSAADYDITVLGATGKYDKTRPGIGSVASRVIEHAPGVVLVARELAAGSSLRILACVDGSSASDRALNTLIKYFNYGAAEITLMHVVETPWVHLGLDHEWLTESAASREEFRSELQIERELQVEAEEVLESARELLTRHGLSVNIVVEEGNPATEILGQADTGEYDLVLVGATGASDVKHEMLGSVSSKVAAQAPCSVVVVKEW